MLKAYSNLAEYDLLLLPARNVLKSTFKTPDGKGRIITMINTDEGPHYTGGSSLSIMGHFSDKIVIPFTEFEQ